LGNRGLERILEDILDPNRDVDPAFHATVFTLKDGDVVSGLFRREEGERIILADSTGKEIPVAKSQVQDRRESATSLMPENFGDIIQEGEFYDLLAFLLSHSGAGKPQGKARRCRAKGAKVAKEKARGRTTGGGAG